MLDAIDWKSKQPDEVEASSFAEAGEKATSLGYPVFVRVSVADPRVIDADHLPGVVCKTPDTVQKFLRYWNFRSSIDVAFISHFVEPPNDD